MKILNKILTLAFLTTFFGTAGIGKARASITEYYNPENNTIVLTDRTKKLELKLFYYDGIPGGLSREAVGNYKTFNHDGEKLVLTDGDKDGNLDRVDIYKDGKKLETIWRDISDEDIFSEKYNEDGTYDLGFNPNDIKDLEAFKEREKKEFNYYNQNFWLGMA